MSYEAWRITFQDPEQAARAAYQQLQKTNGKLQAMIEHCRIAEEERDSARQRLALLNDDGAWHWMNDGNDHLESLSCLVLIPAHELRGLIANSKTEGWQLAANHLAALDAPKCAQFFREGAVNHLNNRAERMRQQETTPCPTQS